MAQRVLPCPIPAGAWILTSALRVGLARHVGQAVRDHSLASTSTKVRVVAIGIASLGRVLHRQLLDDAQVAAGSWCHGRGVLVGLGGWKAEWTGQSLPSEAPQGQRGLGHRVRLQKGTELEMGGAQGCGASTCQQVAVWLRGQVLWRWLGSQGVHRGTTWPPSQRPVKPWARGFAHWCLFTAPTQGVCDMAK